MPEATREFNDVKKLALRYRTRAALHANTLLTLLLCGVGSLIGAGYCSIKGLHKWDQFFAMVGIISLVVEALLYGVFHFRHWHDRATEYQTALGNLDGGVPPATVRANLGPAPAGWSWQNDLGDWVAEFRWMGRRLFAAFTQLMLMLALAAVICAGAILLMHVFGRSEGDHQPDAPMSGSVERSPNRP